jgi:hypothetical protein
MTSGDATFVPEGASYNYSQMFERYSKLLILKRNDIGTQCLFAWINSKLFSSTDLSSKDRDEADIADEVVTHNRDVEDLFGSALDEDTLVPPAVADEHAPMPLATTGVATLRTPGLEMAGTKMPPTHASSVHEDALPFPIINPGDSSPATIVSALSQAPQKRKTVASHSRKKAATAVPNDNTPQLGATTRRSRQEGKMPAT